MLQSSTEDMGFQTGADIAMRPSQLSSNPGTGHLDTAADSHRHLLPNLPSHWMCNGFNKLRCGRHLSLVLQSSTEDMGFQTGADIAMRPSQVSSNPGTGHLDTAADSHRHLPPSLPSIWIYNGCKKLRCKRRLSRSAQSSGGVSCSPPRS